MKVGDLVRSGRFPEKVGVILEIFGDLDVNDPWIRVRWTVPAHSYEWCKQGGLTILSEHQNRNESKK
jgi:hypothetical protein